MLLLFFFLFNRGRQSSTSINKYYAGAEGGRKKNTFMNNMALCQTFYPCCFCTCTKIEPQLYTKNQALSSIRFQQALLNLILEKPLEMTFSCTKSCYSKCQEKGRINNFMKFDIDKIKLNKRLLCFSMHFYL